MRERQARIARAAADRTHPAQHRRLRDVGVRRWRNGAMVDQRDVEALHPVMRATSVARSRLRRGTLVLARVPFVDEPEPQAPGTGCRQDKLRPFVVMRVVGETVVGYPCTSASSRFNYPWLYCEVQDLASAGLARPTGVRLCGTTLRIASCVEVRGVLAADDLRMLYEPVAVRLGNGRRTAGRSTTS